MHPKRVLHIEGDRHFIDSLGRFLSKEGFEVEHATQGEAGLEAALKNPPQAILLAIRLPKKDGFQVLEMLKTDPRTSSIPIIILSDLSSREEIKRCLKSGAFDYVIKSHAHPRDVVSCLRRALGERPGFTLAEWAVVLGIFLAASSLAWFQVGRYQASERDAARLARAQVLAGAFRSAVQERQVLVGCTSGDQLTACRLCYDEACAREAASIPSLTMDDPSGLQKLAGETACQANSSGPCPWSIEREGELPLSLEHFLIRFFIERGQPGLAGGRTHTVNAAGLVE